MEVGTFENKKREKHRTSNHTNTRAAAAAVSGVVGRTLRVRKYVSRAGAACRAGRRIS